MYCDRGRDHSQYRSMNDTRATDAKLSHINDQGEVRMVDVSTKLVTERTAIASAVVTMQQSALDAVLQRTLPKGDALACARVAGILAAKKTSELIPLCHPLPLDTVSISFERHGDTELHIECLAKTSSKTGVEMEALIGAAIAALTIYDMTKAVDKSAVIGPIQLEKKSGGKSGSFSRAT